MSSVSNVVAPAVDLPLVEPPRLSRPATLPTWQVAASRLAATSELERRVRTMLTTYSNVHRGSGQHSLATTALYERAREIVLEYLGLDGARYEVIFASPDGARRLESAIESDCVHVLSSETIGLPLGVRALAVKGSALPPGEPIRTGGGTARILSENSVIWQSPPDRFEAGTPGIVNVVAMACALQMTRCFGVGAFQLKAEDGLVLEVSSWDDPVLPSGEKLLRFLRESMIGLGANVPTVGGVRPYVNLDNASSTQTFQPVWDAVRAAWRQPERERYRILSATRRICAEFVGAPKEEYAVVFTSNTTEAINVAASTIGTATGGEIRPVVINTWLEHNSNELPWRGVPGGKLLKIPVDRDGFLDLGELERCLRTYNLEQEQGRHRVILVAVSGASNVLGTYNDLESVARIAHRYGALVLVDAAQMVAHRRIEVAKWGIDYLVFSGHKIYAPFGTGALVARRDLLRGNRDSWETLNQSGEENLVGIAALGRALELLQRIGLDVIEAEERRLTRRLLEGLHRIPGVEIWGVSDPDSPNLLRRGGIVSFSLKQVPHNQIALELAERGGIGIRSGCHCAHLLVKRLLGINCLRARLADLGLLAFPEFTSDLLPGLARVSLGIGNDEQDVDHFLRSLADVSALARSRTERFLAGHHNGTPFLRPTVVGERVDAWIVTRLDEVYQMGRTQHPSDSTARTHEESPRLGTLGDGIAEHHASRAAAHTIPDPKPGNHSRKMADIVSV